MILVKRSEWGARAPKNRSIGNLNGKPAGHWNGPIITVGGRSSWQHSVCPGLVRGIQNFHMDGNGWADIAYNFLVCPHDYVFEGRGFNVINAANGTNVANRTSHGIMWLAGDGNAFTDVDKLVFRECVKYVADHTDAPDEAVGHRDHHSTQCPGDERYNWIHSGMPVSGGLGNPFGFWPNQPKPVLKRGSVSEAVRYLQNVIAQRAGGNIQVDGNFGPGTERRVKDLQSFFKLAADGIVGPKTWGVVDFLARS